MEEKYRKYSIEHFTQDKKFVDWVKKGANTTEWQKFIRENPNQKNEIETARRIINILKMKDVRIVEEEMYSGWKIVEHFYELHHKKRRKINVKKFLRYAAVFILALAIGAAIPYYYFMSKEQRFSEIRLDAPTDSKEARLVLSGGEEIILKNKQTNLEFSSSGDQIKIDQDSVITPKPNKISGDNLNQLILPYGMIKSDLLLSDGTRVWLNAGSTLIFPQKFGGKERKVFLKGEAYFEVAHVANNPFIVKTNELDVEVLGTKFNLKNNVSDEEMEVVLVEGLVSLRENNVFNFLNKNIVLEPKQRAVYNKINNKTEIISDVDTEYYTSWKEGLLQFKRESILNVFKRLSRFYNVRFVTERNVELHRKISGKLDLKESLEDVLKVVSDAAPIDYKIEGDKVYVYEKKLDYLPMR